jgi:LysM repeat protein
MEPSSQRTCPACGTPVAQRAESCLMCGAQLKEPKTRGLRLPQADLLLPFLLVAVLIALWLWKPWQTEEPSAMALDTATPTSTPRPSATVASAPTATPLFSPTPPPTLTLPPNQTRHTVAAGQTLITIAKLYGTTLKDLLRANSLKESSILSIGDELIVPLPIANTSTPTPSPTPSPTPFTYVVRTADTLSEIARKYGTTVEALMQANGIEDATRLGVGTKLVIVQPPDFSATMAYEIYEVKPGDTLISISGRYGVPVTEIREANKLEGNNIGIGQNLKIPAGTATPSPTPSLTPTLTPTPGPPRSAPILLGPPDETLFVGPDMAILLNWTSVGILDEDEWYVLRLRRQGRVAEQLPVVWTKATSWRLPRELYEAGLDEPQRFFWQVSIMRLIGESEDGTRTGERNSPSSESRTFSWE